MSGAIETAQLQPLDDNAVQRRRAAITCANHILATGGNPHQLLELLRAVGLARDPHALVRVATDPKRTTRAHTPET